MPTISRLTLPIAVLLGVGIVPFGHHDVAAAIAAPRDLAGAARGEGRVALTWSATLGAAKYRVQRDGVRVATVKTASYVDAPAIESTFSYRVRAVARDGTVGPWSATIIVVNDRTPPSVPTDLEARAEPLGISLAWVASTDNRPGTLRYRVFRDDVHIGTTTGTTHLHPVVSNNGSYKIRAVDVAGNRGPFSVSVAAIAAETPAVPAAPANFAAVANANGAAVLSWSGVDGASSYRISRGELTFSVTDTSYTDWPAGRPPGNYSYSVRAISVTGEPGPASNDMTVGVDPALFPFAGTTISYGTRDRAAVALTFDDCDRTNNVRQIVNVLREYNAAAAFFCTGEAMSRAPELYADLARDFPLHNHSWSHPNLTQLSGEQIVDEIRRTTDLIDRLTGRPMAPLMRAPYGRTSIVSRATIAQLGLPLINWDIDTRDWEAAATVATVRDKALRATNGSIVLMHDRLVTVSALPEIITGLRAKGLRLVTVNELLGLPLPPSS